jgi:hypothetical protein
LRRRLNGFRSLALTICCVSSRRPGR